MQIVGKFLSQIQKDDSTGIGVFEFQLTKEDKKITAIGMAPKLKERRTYLLNGSFAYNGQFRMKSLRCFTESREEAILILSHDIAGISEKTAEEIIRVIGSDPFGYEETKGDLKKKLNGIRGIGEKKAEIIYDFLHKGAEENKLFYFLSELGTPYSSILSYIKDGKTRKDLFNNPYLLMRYDASFVLCDKIAMKYGCDPWDFKRIRAVIRHTLKRMENNGNTRMEFDKLIGYIQFYTRVYGKSTTRIPENLASYFLFEERSAWILKDEEKTYVASRKLYDREREIADNLVRLLKTAKKNKEDLKPVIQDVERFHHISYNKEQKEVFNLLNTGGVSILLGGPGTGKTTVINGLVCAYRNLHPEGRILLCAPTGRAASRMAEVSGVEAKTMHKSMNLKWYNDNFVVDPLTFDLIIVDEMSMCDTEIFAVFLSAIVSGATVLLTGDYEQLPSVGPGQVLRDLVVSKKLPIFRLTETIRQKKESMIIRNAQAILKGEPLLKGPDFHIQTMDDEAILKFIKEQKQDPNTQLMIPIKKGKTGCDVCNRIIQNSFQFQDPGIYIDDICFHVHDRVIMNQNNYEYGYMNGDVGTIETIANGTLEIAFAGKTLRLRVKDCSGMTLSYALTVHKSQGAECDHVVLLLPKESICMAQRELLYTAITRAKKTVTIIESPGILNTYIHAEGKSIRDCGLQTMLETQFDS